MVSHQQAPVLCECIDTRTGTIFTAGGEKPVFIMQLYNEAINEPLIKYLNCNSKTAGKYKVPHNSDFAKLYRSTIGSNPKKRFSEAHKILNHFLGHWFIAKYETAHLKKGQQYLKITHIEPETPVKNDAWTFDGTLKKTARRIPVKTLESADISQKIYGQLGDKKGVNRGKLADDEKPKTAISLGLEPAFYPTKTLSIQGKATNTLDHILPEPRIFNYSKLENETNDEYHNRIIDESFINNGWEKSQVILETDIRRADEVIFTQSHQNWINDYDGIQPGQTA